MPISERARRAMQELGLTDYEIRAYTSLLELGSATASEVTEASDVPYSKIYEVLGSLEKKGWVEMEHGRPSKYYPKPPSVAVEVTKLELENAVHKNEQLILQELQPVYERKEVHEKPDIWIVRGEFNILAKIRETVEAAQKEILASVPAIPDAVLDLLVPVLKTVNERGVKIQIMTLKTTPHSSLSKLVKLCEVRVRDQMFGGGIIVDARQVVLLLAQDGEEQVSLAIWSDHPSLTKYARNYFEYVWQEARGVEEALKAHQRR